MLKRILTAVVLLAVVFGTILGLRQVYVEFADLVAVAICILGVYEMAQAFKKAEYNAIKGSLTVGCVTIYPLILLFEKTLGKGELGIILSLVFSLMIAISEFTLIHKFELKDLLATVFILIYPCVVNTYYDRYDGIFCRHYIQRKKTLSQYQSQKDDKRSDRRSIGRNYRRNACIRTV